MAFSANNFEIQQSQFNSETIYIAVDTDTKIYKGSAVFVRSGKAVNGLSEGDLFAGVCKETVRNGNRPYVCVDTKGVFAFKYADSPSIGKVAYIDNTLDNVTITVTAPVTGLSIPIGVIVDVFNGYAWVRIDNSIFNVVADVTPETVIAVTGVTLNNKTKTLTVGDTYTLVATVAPADATNKAVRWQSNNTDIVTVDEGEITGVSAGKASVVVTTIDGHFTAQCMVTVNELEPEEPQAEGGE